MDTSLLIAASNTVKESFEFFQEYGYILSEFKITNNEECKIVYTNNEKSKDIKFSVCNYNDVQRFFITISIVRIPYIVAHDLVSFDVFMDKNHIKHPESLEGVQRNIENANRYIEHSAHLFKEHCMKLITSNKQFPHYFPEWT